MVGRGYKGICVSTADRRRTSLPTIYSRTSTFRPSDGVRFLSAGAKPALGLAIWLGLWQLWAGVWHPDSIVLSPPTSIANYAVHHGSDLLSAGRSTLVVVLIGFGIALVGSVALAIIFTLVPLLREM